MPVPKLITKIFRSKSKRNASIESKKFSDVDALGQLVSPQPQTLPIEGKSSGAFSCIPEDILRSIIRKLSDDSLIALGATCRFNFTFIFRLCGDSLLQDRTRVLSIKGSDDTATHCLQSCVQDLHVATRGDMMEFQAPFEHKASSLRAALSIRRFDLPPILRHVVHASGRSFDEVVQLAFEPHSIPIRQSQVWDAFGDAFKEKENLQLGHLEPILNASQLGEIFQADEDAMLDLVKTNRPFEVPYMEANKALPRVNKLINAICKYLECASVMMWRDVGMQREARDGLNGSRFLIIGPKSGLLFQYETFVAWCGQDPYSDYIPTCGMG
eukprot:TRINITY_DN9548_c0_g1_i1.p1 TRINITY_DN9548_c0_g1~~TRINITY_DN9548_c0_g1_i1.p1  ORF type:complete len:327 (+),score=43.71 TRINITY_DN9548_c0_g1_i1:194-1174(+)